MKLRHVRAVAVCALVVIALTGARRSHGGGCDGSSGSSSSSSSGGYSSSGSSGDYSSSGSTTSSGGYTGSPTAGSTTPPESEIRITDCKVDNTTGKLSAQLSVRNGNSQSGATYNGSVRFTDGTGGYVGTAHITSLYVAAGQTRPTTISGIFIKDPNGPGPTSGKCTLGRVFKTNS